MKPSKRIRKLIKEDVRAQVFERLYDAGLDDEYIVRFTNGVTYSVELPLSRTTFEVDIDIAY